MSNKVIMKKLLFFLTTIILPVTTLAQYNTVKFATEANEVNGFTIMDSDFNFISFFSSKHPDSLLFSTYLYKFNNDGDTLFSRQFLKEDTVVGISNIVQCNTNPIEYFMYAICYKKGDDPRNTFSVFYKIDEEFDVIWEKLYHLRPGILSSSDGYPKILQKKDDGFIFATNLGANYHLVLFEMSSIGDSMNYRYYQGDSAGMYLSDFIYNYDSTAYLALTTWAHPDGTFRIAQAISIDTNLNQTHVYYFPKYFDDIIVAKVAPSGNYIAGGGYFETTYPQGESSMAVYKLDTGFNLLGNCFVGDPDFDIRKDPGYVSMDFYDPNSIFVAGTFDFDIGIWINHPSWIVIGKVDSNMNLLTEKYIGGDAYYRFNTITATNDGGIFIGASRYDYLTQDHEHDAYYYRFDSIEMTVAIDERNEESILQNAIVYPNPASKSFFVRTSCLRSELILFNVNGEKVLTQSITGLVTEIKSVSLPSGVYIWQVVQEGKQIESGKLIITN